LPQNRFHNHPPPKFTPSTYTKNQLKPTHTPAPPRRTLPHQPNPHTSNVAVSAHNTHAPQTRCKRATTVDLLSSAHVTADQALRAL